MARHFYDSLSNDWRDLQFLSANPVAPCDHVMPFRAFPNEWKFIVNLCELLVNRLSRYEMVFVQHILLEVCRVWVSKSVSMKMKQFSFTEITFQLILL